MEKIGNVTMNYQFYNGSDDYSDGDIENDILEYVEKYDDVIEVLKMEQRWPVLYHLSPVRQNILDWYDIKPDAEVLEIGAGCGAVTGALCRKSKKVTSVELSKKRALINANRNKDFENLNIIVGNFNDIEFSEKYDYITLIGVLEYAAYFTNTNNSFVDFLGRIKQLLKPEGKLLIAIENKFGMKYFSGHTEDHTGRLFDGIEGYMGCESRVRTFSKDELREIISEAGYKDSRFYYPFPDYKFPVQIFSDDYMPNPEDIVCSLDSYDNDWIRLFDETAAFAGIIKAGKFDFFSNSFFVEASLEDFDRNEKRKVYSKITKDRRPVYQIETAIYMDGTTGKYQAVKSPVREEAVKHVVGMYENYEQMTREERHVSARLCPCKLDGNKVTFEYINGISFCDKLLNLLRLGNRKGFEKLLFEYESMVYDFAASIPNGGYDKKTKRVRNMNIDLTFDNIIEVDSGDYRVIDYEWCMENEEPVKYVFYRALFAFYMRFYDRVSKYYALDELMKLFDISNEEQMEYAQKNIDFIDYVYDSEAGYNKILEKYKKRTVVFEHRSMFHENYMQLFVDEGNGFTEERSEKRPISNERMYQTYEFSLEKYDRVKALRFDPYNERAVVKINSIMAVYEDGSTKECEILEHNAVVKSIKSYLFENEDPQIILAGEEGMKKLMVELKITFKSFSDISEVIRLTNLRNVKEFERDVENLNEIMDILEKNRQVLPDIDKYYVVTQKLMDEEKKKLESLRSPVSMTDTFKEENKIFVNEMINLAYLRRDIEEELRKTIEKKDKLERELDYIKSTKAYRMLLQKKVDDYMNGD